MKTVVYSLILFFAGVMNSYAQDFQFLQVDQYEKLNNAASPALIEGYGQLNIAYRSRWDKTSPFRDMMIRYDHKVENFGFGLGLLQNDAQGNSLKSTKLSLQFSYKHSMSYTDDFLAIGINTSLIQKRFEEGSLQFDNQYSEGVGFDSGLSSGENFTKANQIVPSLNVSLLGKKFLDRMSLELGLSFNNLNKPSIGFYDEEKEEIPAEIFVFSRIKLPWSDTFEGVIHLAYRKNKLLNERIVGIRLNSELFDDNWVHAGVYSRLQESFFIEVGYTFQKSQLVINYDIGSSAMAKMQGHVSVLELSFKNDF